MPSLTIRNLDEPLKRRLRLRAAARNRSMEEEARQILRSALAAPIAPAQDLGERIHLRFAPLRGVDLTIAPREAIRTPPSFDEAPPSAAGQAALSKTSRTRKRGGVA